MLSTLLGALQTRLSGSAGFVLSSLLPVLLFVVGMGAAAYGADVEFRQWLIALHWTDQSLFAVAALLTVFGLAYVHSMVSNSLLQTLEGRHLPPWLVAVLHHGQAARLTHLENTEEGIRQELRRLQAASDWRKELPHASAHRPKLRGCTYPSGWWATIRALIFGPPVVRHISAIRLRKSFGLTLRAEKVHRAVSELATDLREQKGTRDIGAPPHGNRRAAAEYHNAVAMERAEADLLRAIDYAQDKYQAALIWSFNTRQFDYPNSPPGLRTSARPENVLAPTSLGNIAKTVRSYSRTRYHLDSDVLWTRLQKTMLGTDQFFSALQDSRAQVDCAVALSWFAGLFTLIWATLFVSVYAAVGPFLLVGILGPICTYGMYRLSCENYRAFADLLRTAIDLYRFELLKALHLPLPSSIDEERRLWEAISQRTGYGDDAVALQLVYKHSQSS